MEVEVDSRGITGVDGLLSICTASATGWEDALSLGKLSRFLSIDRTCAAPFNDDCGMEDASMLLAPPLADENAR